MCGESPIPIGDWTSQVGSSVGAGVVIRLRDDGDARELDGDTMLVPWPTVARMNGNELRYTGLPDAAPFTLEITASGSILDDDFTINYGFLRDGRRVLGIRRQGAWLSAGGKPYILLDPLYTIADHVDRFNQTDDPGLESRMLRWARIADMLPRDAIVKNEHLRSLRIIVASSFELSPFVNADGEPDFDPVVGTRETRETETGEEEEAFTAALPSARQRDFAQYFRGLRRVKHRYPVGAGWYVVLTPDVERALVIVRRAQAGSAAERSDFLMNASAHLRAELDVGGDADDFDRVFSDDDLSERVEGVGIWTKKILPWIQRAAEPWLPPEALGLRIGDRIVRLSADELHGLLERIKSAAERGDPTVRVREGVDIPADVSAIAAVEELMRMMPAVQPPEPGNAAAGTEHDRKVGDRVLLVIDNLEQTRFSRRRKEREPANESVTPLLRTRLLAHQEEALVWLMRHWNAGSWGALLADDMGLGKTLSALAFLSWLQRTRALHERLQICPLLLVAPAGLLRNWKDEHDAHLAGDGLGPALEAHGKSLRRLRMLRQSQVRHELATGRPTLDIDALKNAGWVLTTYETLRDHQHSFGRVRWRAGVFDEAQKIKNPGVRLTEAALALNVDFALLMTGTPVENRPADIWSILDRAEPGSFGSLKDFSARYERANGATSRMEQLHRALTVPATPEGPPAPMPPALMLRRLKEDRIPDLPQKRLHRRVVEMPPLQAEEYEKAVLGHSHGSSMLQALHRLRSISLHPFAPDALDLDSYIGASARLSETFRVLEQIADSGEKALLFVESREMQNFLIGALRQRFWLRDDVLVINGAVSGRARKARVDTFQQRTGFDVMILSPRAGGVGLTLTAANHVIHLSRWWNPAVEDQCTDRIFRIGQRRTVHVYLPLARHPWFGDYSFDLRLDGLMKRKREMNRLVLAPPAATTTDVQELYRSTMTEARKAETARSIATADDKPKTGIDIDLLEPTRFEDWVLRQLAEAGYETRRTPRSGDRGADGLAIHRGEESHTIILQCKHLAPDRQCGIGAVREVLGSIGEYKLEGEARPMVVTNAAGFTRDARRLADASDVRLVDRRSVDRLRNWLDVERE